MPLDPHTWAKLDQVTATILNGDLASYQAQQFAPVGVRFHARRPLYKATQTQGGLTVGANAWRGMFQDHGSNVLVDTSAIFGAQVDSTYRGIIQDALAYSDGNTATAFGGGGYYLTSAFAPMNLQTGYQGRVNIASGFNGTSPVNTGTGTAQAGNGSHDTCPYVVDLIHFGNGSYEPVVNNGGPSSVALRTSPDGSGETCYFNAQWVSVNPQYGFVASQPAPKTSWVSGTDQVTAQLLNGPNGIRDVLRVLNMPPMLKATTIAVTTCNPSTDTTIQMTTNGGVDSYGKWGSYTTPQYVVPMDGVYLCYGVVPFQATSSSVAAKAGINVNGTTYWGPISFMPANNVNSVAKLQILDLRVGDVVQLRGFQGTGSALGTQGGTGSITPVLIMVWLGASTTPGSLPGLPDLSYRYAAGMTPAATLSAFNSHLANDLNFLVQKPFLLARQGTAQAIPQSTSTPLYMDTITGRANGTPGDNYAGWDSTNKRYVAQRAGWYLAVMETFFGVPPLTSTPSTIAMFQVSTSGGAGSAWDWYQHMNLPTVVSPGGAAAMGYYYLRAGDWITPGVQTQDTASGTFSTSAGLSHFECVWISE